jgi:hypothetical protein
MKRAEEFLGDEVPVVLNIYAELGQTIRKQNLLQESEEVLSTCARMHIKATGGDYLDTLWTMHELGRTLCERGKFKEAVAWLEICFRRRLKVLGLDDEDTVSLVLGLVAPTRFKSCIQMHWQCTAK